MISVRIKKGFRLNIEGSPMPEVKELDKPAYIGVLPEKIPFIKPRLCVSVGNKVNIGSPLFEDKANPDIRFVSPGGGNISDIVYGPRRVIQAIVVKLDENESCVRFEPVSEKALNEISQTELKSRIIEGGILPFFRELPFRNIPNPDVVPPAIIVTLGSEEPFQPDSEIYLSGNESLFAFGLQILKRLSEKVYVSASHNRAGKFNGFVTHAYNGVYPADDAGVLLYHIKKSSSENRAWYINGQDVLLLARFFKNGVYPTQRIIVLGGSAAQNKKHFKTRLGVPIKHVIISDSTGDIPENTRLISGGIFTGYNTSEDSYLGLYETSILMVPEGGERELFGFLMPGADKPSYSRAFLSYFKNTPTVMDCRIHGEKRACVNCGACADICPVDILPQFAIKCIIADEIEEALAHGILDCAECGLCTYVCPSKIEICKIIKDAKCSSEIRK